MSTLYELTGDYEYLINKLYDPEWDEETLIDTLDGIEGEIEDKADGYARILAQMDGDIAALKEQEHRLADRRRVLENRAKRLKDNLFTAMKTVGKTKFQTPLFAFSIRKTPAAVIIDDPAEIPDKYKTFVESILKSDIKDALKRGEELPGAHLEQGETLSIR